MLAEGVGVGTKVANDLEQPLLEGGGFAAGKGLGPVDETPGLTVSELKSFLMSSVDPLPQWSGKVVTGGRLNMYKALVAATGGPTAPA